MMSDSDSPLATFERLRPRLFGIAYRMLGSVHDAEDVVQESYLRWQGADAAEIRAAEGWLVAVTTRLAVDRLRRAANEREAYVGQWLPEPIATPADRETELASDLSIAFLVLLERLAPEERAAFLLREVFGAGYDEIARTLDKSEAACRQMVHRARERVRRQERRFEVPDDARERLLEQFVTALAAEDQDGVLATLSPDVIFVSDGGGKMPALPAAVRGGARLAELLVAFEHQGRELLARERRGPLTHQIARINGELAVLTLVEGRTLFATSFEFGEDHGGAGGLRITGAYRVMNPDKLRHVGPPTFLQGPWRGLRSMPSAN